MGDNAGTAVQGYLSPLGKPLGKGLETASKPLGGIVEPTVGTVMRAGEAFGETTNVGFGNKEGGPKAAGEKEQAKLKEGLGGKEEGGDNPLGL